jgi:hypothetical protein
MLRRLRSRGIIRSRKPKMGRTYDCQKKKYKSTNNDLQNTTQKTKDRAIRTPQKNSGVYSGAP